MKNCGNELIGQIPEHWIVIRLKDVGQIETSSVDKKIVEGEELIKLVNYSDVYNNSLKEIWNNEGYMSVSANPKQISDKKLIEGDVLFTPSSETMEDIGVSAVVMEDLEQTLYSYHLLRVRFSKNINKSYKKYLFNNYFVQYYFSENSKGTTRQILGLNVFENLRIYITPDINEQEEIANFLDDKLYRIDEIKENIDSQIETLKEFRKTLINDVVTGKVKVT